MRGMGEGRCGVGGDEGVGGPLSQPSPTMVEGLKGFSRLAPVTSGPERHTYALASAAWGAIGGWGWVAWAIRGALATGSPLDRRVY